MADLVVQDVVKRYGSVVGVDHISMRCADGEFVALLGPSGCGKSSTMRMIAGLEDISEGTITIGGRRVNDVSPAERNVAMAFENFGLYPHLSVFGNIAYPLRLRGTTDDSIARAVVDITIVLGISHLLDQNTRQLSVGVKQRVSLARALVRKPTIFLMDEPLSHVDAELRGQMRTELKRLHTYNKSTSLYVTHDQLEAMSMADRIVIMNRGSIQQIGTPDEVYHAPANRFVAGFIGEPPMNFLAARIEGRHSPLIEGVRFDLGESANVQMLAGMSKVDVGVRPDKFLLVSEENRGLPGRVRVREAIGRAALLTIDTGEHRLRVRVARDLAPAEGSKVNLAVNPEHLYLFDPVTGSALRPRSDRRVG
jgi:multiple sugar transport system ATP-binding protein